MDAASTYQTSSAGFSTGTDLDHDRRMVEDIKRMADEKRTRLYVVATGAGAGIQQQLWSVPGCSSFFVGAHFPYAAAETQAFLGFPPEHFASEDTAIDLAMAAYQRAIDLDDLSAEPIGLGLTASVASLEVHRGEHRVHIACVTRSDVLLQPITLPKGTGYDRRREDGTLADKLALVLLRCALDPSYVPFDTTGFEGIHQVRQRARERFFLRPAFDRGRRCSFAEIDQPAQRPLFAGAFNPPHEGHEGMADYAAKTHAVGGEPIFTICADMPHKDPLTVQDMLTRAKMLRHRSVLFLEGAPFYIDMARRFPGRTLLLGADALERMLDPKWGIEPKALMRELKKLGTSLLVFDRDVGTSLSTYELLRRADVVRAFQDRTVMRAAPGITWKISSTDRRKAVDTK